MYAGHSGQFSIGKFGKGDSALRYPAIVAVNGDRLFVLDDYRMLSPVPLKPGGCSLILIGIPSARRPATFDFGGGFPGHALDELWKIRCSGMGLPVFPSELLELRLLRLLRLIDLSGNRIESRRSPCVARRLMCGPEAGESGPEASEPGPMQVLPWPRRPWLGSERRTVDAGQHPSGIWPPRAVAHSSCHAGACLRTDPIGRYAKRVGTNPGMVFAWPHGP